MKRGVLFLLLCSFLACVPENKSISPITLGELDSLFQKDALIQLVDVRTKEEFQEGHIPNALLIDVKQDNFLKRAKEKLDKQKPIYLYCRSGVRSAKAAKKLIESNEFGKVYCLAGGYLAWSQKQK